MNRSVSMDRIKYIGFDMDYTLIGKKDASALTVWNEVAFYPSFIPVLWP